MYDEHPEYLGHGGGGKKDKKKKDKKEKDSRISTKHIRSRFIECAS